MGERICIHIQYTHFALLQKTLSYRGKLNSLQSVARAGQLIKCLKLSPLQISNFVRLKSSEM